MSLFYLKLPWSSLMVGSPASIRLEAVLWWPMLKLHSGESLAYEEDCAARRESVNKQLALACCTAMKVYYIARRNRGNDYLVFNVKMKYLCEIELAESLIIGENIRRHCWRIKSLAENRLYSRRENKYKKTQCLCRRRRSWLKSESSMKRKRSYKEKYQRKHHLSWRE